MTQLIYVPSSKEERRDGEDEEKTKPKLKVTMVGWSIDDSLVVTAVSDYSLKVWCGYTGKLHHTLMVSLSVLIRNTHSTITQRLIASDKKESELG